MKTFSTNWKASYWPEPRLGTSETRNDVLRRLGKLKPKGQRKPALSLDDALKALAALRQ